MKTAYALVSGSYSDYQVHAVFADKKAAKAAADLVNQGENSYEELSIEPMAYYADGETATEVTVHVWLQEFRDDGTVGEPSVISRKYLDYDLDHRMKPRPHVRFVRAPWHQDKGGRLEVTGTDWEGVAKAATDMRGQLLAHRDITGKVGPERNK